MTLGGSAPACNRVPQWAHLVTGVKSPLRVEGRPADASHRLLRRFALGEYEGRRVVTSAPNPGHSGGHALATQTFRPEPESLAPIRAFADRWAREVGLGEEQTYRIKLAVCEACANAMDHPKDKGDITLWAWHHLDRFTVDISHPGEFRVKGNQERGHRGMGLPLMVASADEVSFSCLPEGGTRVSLSVFLS